MAVLGMMAEKPFSPVEMEMFDNMRTDGRRYRFASRLDGKDDVINGLIQLKLLKPFSTKVPITVLGFEEFKVVENEHANTRAVGVKFTQVSNQFSRVLFKPNKRDRAMAMLPDTRWNRHLLAASYFDKLYEIDALITIDGEVSGIALTKEIQALALKIKAERAAKAEKAAPNIVKDMANRLTAEQKVAMLKELGIAIPAVEVPVPIKAEIPKIVEIVDVKKEVPKEEEVKKEHHLVRLKRIKGEVMADMAFVATLSAKYGPDIKAIKNSPEFKARVDELYN